LQPFKVIVVKNAEIRKKLREASFDQAQITDGGAVLVFAAWDNYTEERLDAVLEDTAAQRGGVSDTITAYYDRLKASYLPRDAEVNFQHAARQAYIALGLALTAAAFEEVDSTPMEGFVPETYDEILGLRARGLRSVAVLAVGYRADQGDWLAGQKKVRRPLQQFVSVVE
jgi:nitroreductase